jgi:hypothetical protein
MQIIRRNPSRGNDKANSSSARIPKSTSEFFQLRLTPQATAIVYWEI